MSAGGLAASERVGVCKHGQFRKIRTWLLSGRRAGSFGFAGGRTAAGMIPLHVGSGRLMGWLGHGPLTKSGRLSPAYRQAVPTYQLLRGWSR